MAVPFEARRPFGVSGHNDDPMRLLWRDVASRMVLDACGVTSMSKLDKSEYREHLIAMGEAQAWFRNDYDSVALVLELAEVDMEPVRNRILAYIEGREKLDQQPER